MASNTADVMDVLIESYLILFVVPGPKVIKLFFMHHSAEHDIFPAHKC